MDRRLVTVNLDNKDAGLMVDIGEAGMAVQALARIKQGASTSLQFELPGTATRIEASGSVAWVDTISGRAGIRFQNLPDASAACLREWLGFKPAPEQPTTSATSGAAVPALLGPGSKVAEIAALQREIASQGLKGDAALALMVERAHGLTRADGVAIVVGDCRLMTCRASGGLAPPVGADLRPESGLSGECVRTGVTVRCEDTELDPRADREACRALNIRSAVIVPLFSRGNINGLVEVFYASPRAFDGRDVLTLRRMADLIAATLSGPAPREANLPNGATPNPLPNPAPALSAAPAPVIPAAPQPEKVVCEVCGHENQHSSRECEKCDVPLPGGASAEAGKEAAGLGSTLFRSQNDERRRPALSPGLRLLILIAVLLLLVGIWGWQQYKSHRGSVATPVSTTEAGQPPASQ
jgi:hypothetical protein